MQGSQGANSSSQLELSVLITDIAHSDPAARIHIIAHSHGGNVLLKAAEVQAQAEEPGALPLGALPLDRLAPRPPLKHTHKQKSQERYPWGRYRWIDSLLGLPATRQRLFLSHRLATSPLSNALGSLVFLGTPFYVKKWDRAGVFRLVVATVVSGAVVFGVVLGYVVLWEVVVMEAAHLEVNRLMLWPLVVVAIVGLFGAVSIAVQAYLSFESWHQPAYYNGNIYHAPGYHWSPTMSALVIHAGKLDEASLALSVEPIARAYIFPQLRELIKLSFWFPLPPLPTSASSSSPSSSSSSAFLSSSSHSRPHNTQARPFLLWFLYFINLIRVLLWNIIFLVPFALLSLISHILAPALVETVRSVIVTIAFGLSPNELSFASVYVDEVLDLHLWSHRVEHWNVQKLLAEAKTQSLQGKLLPGYHDDTVDAGGGDSEGGEYMEGLGLGGEGGHESERGDGGVGEMVGGGEGKGVEVGGARGIRTVRGVGAAKWKGVGGCIEAPVCDDSVGAVGAVGGFDGGSVGASAGGLTGGSAGAKWKRVGGCIEAPVCDDSVGGIVGSVGGSVGTSAGASAGDIGASSLAVSSAVEADEAEVDFLLEEQEDKEGCGGNENDEKAREKREEQQQQQEQQQMEGSGEQQQQQQQRQQMEGSGEQEHQLLYEFLWEDSKLEEAAAASGTYQLLRSEMRRMKKNPRLTDREFVRQIKQLCVMIEEHIGELTDQAAIKQLCVMIEEHIGELTGRFDLNHGAYFRDPRILAVIAHFLQHRALPDWSRSLDADLLRVQSLTELVQTASGQGTGGRSGGEGEGSGGLGCESGATGMAGVAGVAGIGDAAEGELEELPNLEQSKLGISSSGDCASNSRTPSMVGFRGKRSKSEKKRSKREGNRSWSGQLWLTRGFSGQLSSSQAS
ncbi:unnamed protein product [Closterium sp. NIES-64]|nr:unnamed protein product [Closterium sp. NIES-64]